MASLRNQWGNFQSALSGNNHSSPFGEAGFLGDPLYHLTGGDDGSYAKFMRKTWEIPNEKVGALVAKHDVYDRKINPLHKAMDKTSFGGKAKEMVHNKPGDSALAVLGTIFGGGALMSGMGGGASGGGGMFGSSTGGGNGLGIFSNGGQGGMGSVGTGNAGQLFANTGINTGGVGGVGGTGASGGLSQLGMQDWMSLGQSAQGMMGGGLPGQQQQQNTGPKPYLYRGQIVWM